MNKERYHRALAKAVAEACEKVASRPDALAAGQAETAVFWGGPIPVAPQGMAKEAVDVAWLRRARAVMDLLASPEPPQGVVDELSTFLTPGYDGAAARSVWAWLRRQAGLEGEGE